MAPYRGLKLTEIDVQGKISSVCEDWNTRIGRLRANVVPSINLVLAMRIKPIRWHYKPTSTQAAAFCLKYLERGLIHETYHS